MKRVALSLGVAIAIAAVASCNGDDATAEPCTSIPAGGCPLSHGVACDDPSCKAVYRCLDGNQWELDHVCSGASDAAPHDGAPAVDASDAASYDASIDAPPGAYGGPGCADLQLPDCALGVALACSTGCCGCEDLYVCQNGGWSLWGTCADAGPVPTP